ncbi:helix-turn-helix domain-containing protein [Roseobacteraceae bacterium NS-SX3]
MTSSGEDALLSAFATVLRRYRRAAGISQEELAHRAGRSMRYISLLESCRHQPSLDTLFRLSAALDVTLAELITEVEREASNDLRGR